MAKPKQANLVKVIPPHTVHVWTDDPRTRLFDIENIEGVNEVMLALHNPIYAFVDPRYDIDEVAEEIRTLLASEVPESFREE